MKDFKTLKVWEKSHALTLNVYKTTNFFPKEETFGLMSQLRRASSSIGLNIAEGCGRGSDADFKRFLQMAFGSACEVEYCVFLSKDLNYLTPDISDNLQKDIEDIKKMLSALMNKLK